MSICENRQLNQKVKYEYDSSESRIIEFCNDHEYILNRHFMETLSYFCKMREENPLQLFHETYINPMVKLLQEYLDKHKYKEIIILADNLDKTWDVHNDLSVQIDILLTLFEVTGNIEQELTRNAKNKVRMRVVLFLRQDIFDNMLSHAREPDKLILYKHDIDWSSFPDKLKQLIEKRFQYVLGLSESADMGAIWKDYFDLDLQNKKTVFERLRASCLPRPRDMLMFMRQMFESAVNNSHSKVQEGDFQFTLQQYAEFLYQNLIAETTAAFPNIRSILNELHDKYYDKIELERLALEFEKMPFTECKKADTIIDALVSNGYFELRNSETGEIYNEYYKAKESLAASCRPFLFFKLKP